MGYLERSKLIGSLGFDAEDWGYRDGEEQGFWGDIKVGM
jgi:hypothetical protein